MFPRDPFTLHLPTFARLDEYSDVWAIEPSKARLQLDLLLAMNFQQHAQEPAAARSVVGHFPARGGKSIAVLAATGMLMKQRASTGGTSTIELRRNLAQAVQDPNVSGILLAADSPGGTVGGTMALAEELKAAARKKPTWTQIEDSGLSAMYWLASQTSQIFASVPTAGIGSIGTYLTVKTQPTAEGSTAATVRVFRSGPLKGIGEDGITDDQAAHLQNHVNELNTHFVKAVATGRGLNAAAMADVTQGGIMLAGEAKDKRLIDGIRPMKATLAAMAAL